MFWIAAVLITVAALLSGYAAENKDIKFFDGQMIMREDGVNTKVNYLRGHGRKVILVGTFHYAPRAYFEKFSGVLNSCEQVIVEGPPPSGEISLNESVWRAMIFGENQDEAIIGALNAPPPEKLMEKLGFVHEFLFFYENWKDGWISGDGAWYRMQNESGWTSFWGKQREAVRKIPKDAAEKIIQERRQLILASESGAVTRRNVAHYLTLIFGTYGEFTALVFDSFARPRDEITMGVFDEIVRVKNPKTVCIKFGAYHMSYQIQLLEKRGYVLQQRSEELKVFDLK